MPARVHVTVEASAEHPELPVGRSSSAAPTGSDSELEVHAMPGTQSLKTVPAVSRTR